MPRRLPLAVLALFALVALLVPQPASALPPDCSAEYCASNPGGACAMPGTIQVISCSEWDGLPCAQTPPSEETVATTPEEFLDLLTTELALPTEETEVF